MLREALIDGTLLAVATDHAPHSAEEKSRGLDKSLNGIVGLETAFPVLYTQLVLTGILSLEQLVEAMSTRPMASFRLPEVKEAKASLGIPYGIDVNEPADLGIWDLNAAYTIDPETFLSMGHATPFAGWTVRGMCLNTLVGGESAYEDPAWKERYCD